MLKIFAFNNFLVTNGSPYMQVLNHVSAIRGRPKLGKVRREIKYTYMHIEINF